MICPLRLPHGMAESETDRSGFAGAGRWLAVGSELPCSVIVFLFLGQIIGAELLGPGGGTAGGLVGVMIGLLFGTYSVYVTIRHFEQIEEHTVRRRTYMPPREEIFREYEWPPQDNSD